MRTLDRLLAAGLVLALAAPARADSAEAQRLFERGRALLADGHVADACDAFAASDAAETRVGTLLNLADCREQNQQIATAWAVFRRAAALAQRTPKEHDRAEEARRRAGYLQPRLSFLTISVPASSQIDGLVLRRDGAPVDPEYWNQGVPVDGGTYVVEALVPGQEPWRTDVRVPPENGHVVVEVPGLKHLDDLGPAVEPPAPAPTPAPAPPALDEVALAPAPRFTRLRIGGLAAGGAGVITLGAATWLAIAAGHDADAAWARCPTSPCQDPEADRLGTRALDRAHLSHVLFAGGGVAVAAAVTLWIVGRPAAHRVRVIPHVGADQVGAALSLEL